MHEFISWCGFLGAWLLFAGPVYQAALELTDEQYQTDEIQGLRNDHYRPPVSKWWWLVPPVWYWKSRQAARAHRQELFDSLSDEGMDTALNLMSAATGWLIVAAGAALIAWKETFDLVETHEWPIWTFWVLVVGMGGLGLANTALRIERANVMRRLKSEQQTA